MKKLYTEPELNVTGYDFSDIITMSIASGSGDNEIDASATNWWD